MPPLYTQNLGIEKPANGEEDGSWGVIVNENMDILDRAINGSLALALSGTASTLTTTSGTLNDGQYKLLVLGGTPSGTHTITISPNTAQKIYFVRNTTAQSVVFTQGSGGNVTIATGDSGIIYTNGAGASAAVVNITNDFAMSSAKITGGTIDGTTIGGTSPAVGTFTTANATTVDTTNLEVTNLKAKDGTSAGSIADTTGIVTLASAVLTTASITSGTINSTQIGNVTPASLVATDTEITGELSIADKIVHTGNFDTLIRFPVDDVFAVETAGSERLRVTAAGDVGIGTATPATKLGVNGAISTADGSAAAPAYSFSGDLNTGMYSGGADVLSFSSVGVESLRVAGNGVYLPAATTETKFIEIGAGRTGNGGAIVDLIGDATYTDYGARLIRGTTGPDATTNLTHRGTGNLAITAQDAGIINFYTTNLERMRISAGGNVGIGTTTTPSTKLRVEGTIGASDGTIDLPAYTFSSDLNTGMYRSAEGRLSFTTNGFESMQLNGSTRSFPVETGDGAVILGNGRTGDGAVHYNLIGDTTYTSFGMRLARSAGANGGTTLTHRGTGDLTFVTNEAADIAFRTTNSEAARINSGGQFMVGVTTYVGVTTAPSLQVSDLGHIFVNAVSSSSFNKLTSDGTVMTFRRQNVSVGGITVTGSATSYVTSSDYRLKENVVPVANAADRVLLLQPRNFNFISDPNNPVDGFLAHEAQAIVPNSVVGQKDEVDAEGAPVYQSIDHSKMVPLLTAALQEALAKIAALEVRIAALEA
jgi:hypothetical protein